MVRMRTEMKSALAAAVCVLMSALVVTDSSAVPAASWTKGSSGVSLDGKMFTMSLYGGGVSFFTPYWHPTWSPSPDPTWRYTTPYYNTPTTQDYITPTPPSTQTNRPVTRQMFTTRPYPPWTTAPPTRGVSVCLRYITDYLQTSSPDLFTLSPSTRPLRLSVSQGGSYTLYNNGYSLYLQPRVSLWPDVRQNMWTSICLTVDSVKSVAQMFSDSKMSIRKLMSYRYVWSGEPVIDFSGFDGQLTDLQVYDYPLRYKEVLYYMSGGSYGPYRGSVISWSYISYSARGNTLLEDTYERQAKDRVRQLRDKKRHRKVFIIGEKKDWEQLI